MALVYQFMDRKQWPYWIFGAISPDEALWSLVQFLRGKGEKTCECKMQLVAIMGSEYVPEYLMYRTLDEIKIGFRE